MNLLKEIVNSGTKITINRPNLDNIDGKYIKELRLKINYSQKRLADAIGVKKKTIEKWEKGKKRIGQSYLRLLYLINCDIAIAEKLFTLDIIRRMKNE